MDKEKGLSADGQETERRRLVVEGASKQLAEGTWPQVMMVFGYPTPRAPRTPDEEFVKLKEVYEQAACANIAAFIELVQYEEKAQDVSMSFNLSMRRRLAPGSVPPTKENAIFLFSTPDILVGTRGGIEGAVVWFKNLLEAIPTVAPESLQVMDKIFSEAVGFLMGPSRKTSAEGLLRSAILGAGDTQAASDIPPKH